MIRRHYWLPLAASAILAFAILGCGDDDEKTNNSSVLANGDENSEQFDALAEGASETLEVVGNMFEGMFVVADLILNDPGNPNSIGSGFPRPTAGADDSSFISLTKTYRSGTSDWLVDFSVYGIADDGDTITLVFTDSMKFYHGDTPVQWPDSANLTKITNGMSLTVQEEGATAKIAHGGIFGGNTWSITGAPGAIAGGGDIVINGVGFTDVDISFPLGDSTSSVQGSQAGSCDGVFEFDVLVNDIALNLASIDDDGCPTSGSINFSGDLDVACLSDEGNFSLLGGYSLTMSVVGDSTFYVFRNSSTEWVYHESCGGNDQRAVSSFRSPFDPPRWLSLPGRFQR